MRSLFFSSGYSIFLSLFFTVYCFCLPFHQQLQKNNTYPYKLCVGLIMNNSSALNICTLTYVQDSREVFQRRVKIMCKRMFLKEIQAVEIFRERRNEKKSGNIRIERKVEGKGQPKETKREIFSYNDDGGRRKDNICQARTLTVKQNNLHQISLFFSQTAVTNPCVIENCV